MSLDILTPLLNNTYYETTLKFLLVEYYKCVKNQKELIESIPIDFKEDDKIAMLTIYLLYGNSYAKKLIFKEIVDLVLYNATFLMTLNVSALMEEDMKKKYDSSKLEPNPRVEELMGGGNTAFLQAIMFFSFMFLYRALSQESQLIIRNNGDAGFQISPFNLENVTNVIKNPTGNIIFDPNNKTHMKEFTQQYGDYPIGNDSEFTMDIKKNIYEFSKNLPYDIFDFSTNTDKLLKYINKERREINAAIVDLFGSIENACNSVTGIAKEDQLPIELWKLVKSDITNIVENVAKPELEEKMEMLNPIIEAESMEELREKGIAPVQVTNAIRAAATSENLINNAKETGKNVGRTLLGMFSWSSKPDDNVNRNSNAASTNNVLDNSTLTNSTLTNSTLTNSTSQSPIEIIEQENKYVEELKMTNYRRTIQKKAEVEQNIAFEAYQNASNIYLKNTTQFNEKSNRDSYFNNFCVKSFGNPPKINFDSQNKIISLSNSAESFNSLRIILKNIINYADIIGTSNANEMSRKSLIQRAVELDKFIDRYNGLIGKVINNNREFERIQDITSELRNVVKGLNSEVTFIYEKAYPGDIKKAIEENERAQQVSDLNIKMKADEQSIKNKENEAYVNVKTDQFKNFEKNIKVNTQGVVNSTSTFFEESFAKPGHQFINNTINFGNWLGDELINGLAEKIKTILILGGGVAVVVGGIWFILPSMFKRVRANLDKGTEQIQKGDYGNNDRISSGTSTTYDNRQDEPINPRSLRVTGEYIPEESFGTNSDHRQYYPKQNNGTNSDHRQYYSKQNNIVQEIDPRENQLNYVASREPGEVYDYRIRYPPRRRGGKTRKRAKKGTRKLKRGKRRQTRHRTGRKTKRR
jgi:hypothetical protein